MMDCKKALAATDGDMDAAVDFLREERDLQGTEEGGSHSSWKAP